MPSICVLGAGAWGTAIAIVLAKCGRPVVLAPRRSDHAAQLAASRENADYLPGFPFPETLSVAADPAAALADAQAVLLACPTQGVRGWCERLRETGIALPHLILLCKGLEEGTHLRPSDVVAEVLPGLPRGTLSGPSNAAEVASGHPTAVVLATEGLSPEVQRSLQSMLSAPSLRVYLADDLKGVELGGCLKNIYAIAAGCCDGLGLGDNAKAAMLTRALAEMVRLGSLLGARPETFYGLGGFGDLVATANGSWSRNRTFGEAIAKGARVEDLLAHRKTVVEGYKSTRSFHQLCTERGIDAPILAEVHAILFSAKPPAAALAALMARELKREG